VCTNTDCSTIRVKLADYLQDVQNTTDNVHTYVSATTRIVSGKLVV